MLQRLQRERQLSYLLITHDMDVIQAMAHQVLVLKSGEVVEQGSREAVFNAPQHPYTRALLAASGY
jgi:microcin C transport system ATP-binding protein